MSFLLLFCVFSYGFRPKYAFNKLKVEEGCASTLDNIPTGKVTANQLKNVQKVVLHTEGSYSISGFTVTIAPKNGKAYLLPGFGYSLTNDIKGRIKNLKAGDLLVVSDIKAIGGDGQPLMVKNASYQVVNL